MEKISIVPGYYSHKDAIEAFLGYLRLELEILASAINGDKIEDIAQMTTACREYITHTLISIEKLEISIKGELQRREEREAYDKKGVDKFLGECIAAITQSTLVGAFLKKIEALSTKEKQELILKSIGQLEYDRRVSYAAACKFKRQLEKLSQMNLL